MSIKTAEHSRNNLRTSTATSRKYILGSETELTIAAAYDKARTNLVFALSKSQNKVITFTSANPAEGKSTTCLNTAISLASAGNKTLLIDLDMRKPVIHSLLNVDCNNGSSTVLSGMCAVSEAVKKTMQPNLDVIVSGPVPPNPAELLSSSNTAELIYTLIPHYDYILIDTPPVNVVSDSQLLNDYSAGTVFIIRDGYTRHTDLKKAINQIKHSNGKILGFIKTACRVQNES